MQGLSERVFLLRDQLVPPKEVNDSNVPGWDISINYVPVTYAERYKPAIIEMQPEEVQVTPMLPICSIYICKPFSHTLHSQYACEIAEDNRPRRSAVVVFPRGIL